MLMYNIAPFISNNGICSLSSCSLINLLNYVGISNSKLHIEICEN